MTKDLFELNAVNNNKTYSKRLFDHIQKKKNRNEVGPLCAGDGADIRQARYGSSTLFHTLIRKKQ